MNRIGQGPLIRIERTVFPVRISAMEYAELVAQIPEGYLSTTKLLEKKLCLKYGAQAVEFEGPTPHFIDEDTGKVSLFPPERYDLIPYHRVLSERGYVQDTIMASRDLAVMKLREEGHMIAAVGKSYRIPNYKEKLYDFRSKMLFVEGKVY